MATSQRRRKMEVRETPESSSLARFSYDGRTQILEVEFRHGTIYDYYEVPESVFAEMAAAPSKGRFFVYNVRDEYDFSQVRADR